MRIHWFFGHAHNTQRVIPYLSQGNRFTGYRFPATVDQVTGRYTLASLNPEGGLSFEYRNVVYPFA
jgi:hypothetical protein